MKPMAGLHRGLRGFCGSGCYGSLVQVIFEKRFSCAWESFSSALLVSAAFKVLGT